MTDYKRISAAGLRDLGVFLSRLRLLLPFPAAADAAVSGYAEEILTAQCAGKSVQTWVDTDLTARIGMSSPDWYVMALSVRGGVNLSAYSSGLTQYLQNTRVANATSRERLALALTACHPAPPAVCTELLDSSAEELGIMSRIFGLHLLNNGVPSARYTNAQLACALAALQAPDGGWSLQGTYGDADVTAMTLQALAPYQSQPEIAPAVQNGINFLANTQLPSGAYQSYGAENPESTAQVWLALSCLGIDALNDPRFLRNGKTLLDGILQFRVAEGQYAHTLGGEANVMATVQVFQALTAAEHLQAGGGSFYLFHGAAPQWQTPAPVTTAATVTAPAAHTTLCTAADAGEVTQILPESTGDSAQTTANTATTAASGMAGTSAASASAASAGTTAQTAAAPESTTSRSALTTAPAAPVRTAAEKYPYRIPLTIASAAVFGGIALSFVLRKRHSRKTYLTIACGFCLVTGLIWVIRIESPDQFYTPETRSGGGTVTMEIRCDVILGMEGSEKYPADGVIMPLTEFSIAPDENALTLLYDAVKAYQLQIEVDGVSGEVVETAYVRGIASLYEFDFGDLSGWTYTVNGERPSVGCGACTLHDGDAVAWVYTVNL